jgi:deazaflavin-dependent oxidoreductase (nitroreductase family)
MMQRIVSSRAATWLFSRFMRHFDRLFMALTGGRATLTGIGLGLPVVILVTRGAKSGLVRTHFLLCIRDQVEQNAFAVVASNWGQRHYPAWYFNLKANPHAICSIGGRAGEYVAHEAVGEEYERFWAHAVRTYIGYSLYKQRAGGRRIPIMVMTPVEK